jgi:hypothetical protein
MIAAIQLRNMVICNSFRITAIGLSKKHASKKATDRFFNIAAITETYFIQSRRPNRSV